MSILLLIAGFCVLCLSGCVGVLLIAQKLLNRSFDMVNFNVALSEKLRHIADKIGVDFDEDITHKEGTE